MKGKRVVQCLRQLIFFWAYLIGVASRRIGLKLGKVSDGVQFSEHRNLGRQLRALHLPGGSAAALAILAVVFSILSVFGAMYTFDPDRNGRMLRAYTAIIGTIAGVADILEATGLATVFAVGEWV